VEGETEELDWDSGERRETGGVEPPSRRNPRRGARQVGDESSLGDTHVVYAVRTDFEWQEATKHAVKFTSIEGTAP
jgi:hypothetical protein